MAPKKPAATTAVTATGPATTPNTAPPTFITPPSTTTSKSGSGKSSASPALLSNVYTNVVQYYQKETPQRTRIIDVFMIFLVIVGGIQFAYCVLAGNYPFNAFLSGFSATVGQFVLTASLRIQTNEANKSEFPSVSPERAFADFVVGSLILHFFCINFIN